MTQVGIAKEIRLISQEILKVTTRDELRDLVLQLRLFCNDKVIRELRIDYNYVADHKTNEKEREK